MPDGMLKPGWLPPELCPRAHQGDPRMAVLSVMRLEYYQISLTKLPNMTVESRSRIGRSQSGCQDIIIVIIILLTFDTSVHQVRCRRRRGNGRLLPDVHSTGDPGHVDENPRRPGQPGGDGAGGNWSRAGCVVRSVGVRVGARAAVVRGQAQVRPGAHRHPHRALPVAGRAARLAVPGPAHHRHHGAARDLLRLPAS